MKTLPEANIRLYGEPSTAGPPELTIWPSHKIDELPPDRFDLVLNQDSMPEMSRQIVDDYLDWIGRSCSGAFVSINHESNVSYGDQLAHVRVSDAALPLDTFELEERYPYWLRKGYTVEIYRVGDAARRHETQRLSSGAAAS
ncbi:MAG TPA: hypothetical protein VH025_03195 [Solirubrobacteraceae bacterium]|nr:hypothetical protein [Solirubrobacteraceae bacterium]